MYSALIVALTAINLQPYFKCNYRTLLHFKGLYRNMPCEMTAVKRQHGVDVVYICVWGAIHCTGIHVRVCGDI